MKEGVLPGSNAWVEVSQMISSIAGLTLLPATSGEEAFPLVQVIFSQGLSFEDPLVDVKIVWPSPIEPTIIIET